MTELILKKYTTSNYQDLKLDITLIKKPIKNFNLYLRFINTVNKQKQSRTPLAGLNYALKPAGTNRGASRQGTTVISGRRSTVKRVTNAVGGTNSKLSNNKKITFKLNRKYKKLVIKSALQNLLNNASIIVIDSYNQHISNLNLKEWGLFLKDNNFFNFCLATANQQFIKKVRNVKYCKIFNYAKPCYKQFILNTKFIFDYKLLLKLLTYYGFINR